MGDEFDVMYIGVNAKGKVDLSKKDADNKKKAQQ